MKTTNSFLRLLLRHKHLSVPFTLLAWLLLLTSAFGQQTPFRPHFTNMTELGVLFGQVRYGVTFVSGVNEGVQKRQNITGQTFNGVQLRPRLAVGGVVGVDWYNSALLMPIGAGVRYDLGKPSRNLRIFSSLDTGYGFTWFNEDPTGYKTKGGWMISPGVGFRIGKPQSTNFILSLSYKRQEAEAEKPLGGNELYKYETRVYNRVALRAGISF
ncbi:hypothetical protein [Tellurirhabdus rosea]|uniref:hypothetical protein n=1 Tax=Tellurirhabdus rosea TaxID=2674997 RepID=UPI002256BAB7|nr:hypothetical protein [Tellurirhabdus rosea]